MSDLISRSKIRDYIKTQINPYGKPFEGTAYELGLKIMRYIDAMDSAYDIDKVIEELNELDVKSITRYKNGNFGDFDGVEYYIKKRKAIEIVKQDVISDDVCEWKLEDEEANLYLTGCQQRQLIFEGTPKENGYRYCPYCGKKIKVVE